MDLKDKRILAELDKNARQSISEIAKTIKLSKQSVKNRIDKLEKEKIIKGYYAIIDMFKLDRVAGRAWIKLLGASVDKQQEIIDFALKMRNVGWVVTLDGSYDLVVIFWAKDLIEFYSSLKELEFNYVNYFKRIDISFIVREHHLSHRYLLDDVGLTEWLTSVKYQESQLDETDKKILNELAENARIPLIELSKKLEISDKVIRYRIKNLEQKKILLGYRANINNVKLGYDWYKVFLSLQNLSAAKQKELMNYLKGNKNVIFVTEVIGKADLEFEAMLQTNKDFHELMQELRLKFADIIRDYESVIVYNVHRLYYFPS
ncbi:MAG: Lrp/AsnC family transcriptional regulator [archaeon]